MFVAVDDFTFVVYFHGSSAVSNVYCVPNSVGVVASFNVYTVYGFYDSSDCNTNVSIIAYGYVDSIFYYFYSFGPVSASVSL